MIDNQYALNKNTGRLIKKTTSLYKKLKKLNQVKEIEDDPEVVKVKTVKPVKPEEPEPVEEPEPEFNELDLQHKMAELTTDMVADNVKKIIRSQSLSDKDYDILLKKMLYEKLCVDKPEKKDRRRRRN